jgi:hypothetical protein
MQAEPDAVRDKLIDKIRKVRAKGSDGGVTEAEANAFLDAAARMMAEHGVHDDDLAKAGIGVDPVEKKGVHVSLHRAHPAVICTAAIGKLTGTSIGLRVTTVPVDGGGWREIGSLTIAGRPADREIADYLYDQIRNLIDAAWKAERDRRLAKVGALLAEDEEHLATHRIIQAEVAKMGLGVGHKARRSFGFGMARRISERLETMATRQADSATAMAVWREKNKDTEDKKQKSLDLDFSSYGRGAEVGKDVALSSGISAGQQQVLHIGKSEVPHGR